MKSSVLSKSKSFIFFTFFITQILSCEKKNQENNAVLPSVNTGEILNINTTTVNVGGIIVDDGNALVTERGIVISKSINPTVNDKKAIRGNGTGIFTVDLSDLTPATTYHVRAFGTNSIGTSYGVNKTFKTLETTPTIKTVAISELTAFSAKSGGEIISDGGSPITDKGICYSFQSNPTIADNKISKGSGSENFTLLVESLEISKKYFIRAYATNALGTAYGESIAFTTLSHLKGDGVYDIDNNFYRTVIINDKEWMAENLRTIYVNDGRLITDAWTNRTDRWGINCIGSVTMTEPLVFFRGSPDDEKFGHLYNWYAAQSVCPSGWKLPTAQDFDNLINYLGGYAVAGEKMKDTATGMWKSNINHGSNSSGFSARPAGNLGLNSSSPGDIKIFDEGYNAQFWTDGSLWFQYNCPNTHGVLFLLTSNNNEVSSPSYVGCNCTKAYGRSVRCIKK